MVLFNTCSGGLIRVGDALDDLVVTSCPVNSEPCSSSVANGLCSSDGGCSGSLKCCQFGYKGTCQKTCLPGCPACEVGKTCRLDRAPFPCVGSTCPAITASCQS
ncbi:hypothetical protein FJT64_020962 [Amphibalanus amphitrite]|uniref:WAP domain-containing protein n=1 Tax=Amphibalanus amphitrite TaxID=1232801 RepID=A0A6A4WLN0_AMPAM|nr:hypothetical protein FJT64_020962 [Amphibalanus amphitrite]